MAVPETGLSRIRHDPDAFEGFYRRHIEAVTRFVARRVDDPHTAADVTAYADFIGIIVDAAEFSLWLSPHILENTTRVLQEGLKWEPNDADAYLGLLARAASHSGGGIVDPPRTVSDCTDFEDNAILDLATETGALLIVSDDTDLTSMSPWRGTPILRPREFAAKMDGMRRHRRGRQR